MVFSNTRIGENFSNLTLNNSLKLLYDTDFFSDIKVFMNAGLLKIEVEENPIIDKINIKGIKKKTFEEYASTLFKANDHMKALKYLDKSVGTINFSHEKVSIK